MVITTPDCGIEGCYKAAVGFRQPEDSSTEWTDWEPACEIHVFQSLGDIKDWRICFITQRESVLQLSPS